MNKITACLITTKKEYPSLILERLTCTNFFDEILIATESPSVYKRYELAAEAKNPIIYVQDDDCILNYQTLFRSYNGSITNAMTKPFLSRYEQMGCALVGWGCYFPRQILSSFDKYINTYGKDAHLLREADRIFTYLNKPHNTVIMPHEDLFQNEQRMSSPDNLEFHFKSANEALEKCRLI